MTKKTRKDTEESSKSSELYTVRQYFYINEQYDEMMIKTLERTYIEHLKSSDEWSEIIKAKKIIFK